MTTLALNKPFKPTLANALALFNKTKQHATARDIAKASVAAANTNNIPVAKCTYKGTV